MNIFMILSLIGGLALFLYGMQMMGDGLKKASGGKLEMIIRCRSNSSYSVFFCDNRYGSRICKFRYHAVITCGRRYPWS